MRAVKSIVVVFWQNMTEFIIICDTALTRGHYFDKRDKSRHYLTLMTDDIIGYQKGLWAFVD